MKKLKSYLLVAAGIGIVALLLGLPAHTQLSCNPLVTSCTGTSGSIAFRLLADSTTAIPGGTGSFTSFSPSPALPPNPCISFGNVAFFGAGSGGQQGIYAVLAGTLTKIADLNTAIPNGTGNFIMWQSNPFISGNNVAVIGQGAPCVTCTAAPPP